MTQSSAAKTLSSLRPIAQKFCITAALTVFVVQLILNWLVVCGTTSASSLALLCGLAAGFGLTAVAERRLTDVSRFAWALLGGGLMVLSALIPSVLDSLLTLGTTLSASSGASAGLAFAVPMGFVCGVTLLAGSWWRLQRPTNSLTTPVSLVAIAAGCLAPLANAVLLFPVAWLTCGFVAVEPTTSVRASERTVYYDTLLTTGNMSSLRDQVAVFRDGVHPELPRAILR